MKRFAALIIASVVLCAGCAMASKLDWFSFSFGSYFNGAWDYSVYEYDGDYYLDAQGLNGIDLNITKKKLSGDDIKELMRIISDCELNSWDGFDETDAINDGVDGFTVDISYKNGTVISASGYAKYPEKYWDAWALLTGYFDELAEE